MFTDSAVTSHNNDVNQLDSMITQAQENLEGTDNRVEQVVADEGSYSNDNAQLDLGVEILSPHLEPQPR